MSNERQIWRNTSKYQPHPEGEKTKFLCDVRLEGFEVVSGYKAIYDCVLDIFKPLNYKEGIVVEYKIVEP